MWLNRVIFKISGPPWHDEYQIDETREAVEYDTMNEV